MTSLWGWLRGKVPAWHVEAMDLISSIANNDNK